MKQILCLSYLPWQARPNRTQQLLTRLTGAKVLFFEPVPPKGASIPEQGRRMRSHVTVYTLPTPLPGPRDRSLLQRRRADRAADFVQRVMDKHRFQEPVLWCTAPVHAQFLDRVAYRGTVYDCHRFWGEELTEPEGDLARHAEVVFAASPGLVRRLSPYSDNIALLPNGVNPLLFSQPEHPLPPAMADLPGKKVLGRAGGLTGHLDLEPLLHAARRRPEWTFLLMGRATRQAAQQLQGQDNIVLTGPVNALDLPDYLCRCDLLFDLLRADRRDGDIVPLRIYEYLAAGKPIVSMVEPGLPDPFPPLIYTAYDGQGFLRRCRSALEEDPALPAQRKELARRSSWTDRAAQVSDILEGTGLF